MLRFWNADSKGCDKSEANRKYMPPSEDYFGAVPTTTSYDASGGAPATAAAAVAAAATTAPHAAPPPLLPPRKRKRSLDPVAVMPPSPSAELDSPADRTSPVPAPLAKRIKTERDDDGDEEHGGGSGGGVDGGNRSWPPPRATAYGAGYGPTGFGAIKDEHGGRIASPPSPPPSVSFGLDDTAGLEQVRDVVQYQFGFEILMKHNELRLIDQELAKCQIALEQLRRCHLIPYPTACPTPEQMLDIASGRGTAVRPRPGAAVPKWAAPFGVVDGPYARHYAKWLIPDPVFDGPLPNWPGLAPPPARSKSAATAEARATRNSVPDAGKGGRPTRGLSGQKLHSLSSGYPQPKDKAGPCVLKRADGKVVKLVCIDCHRENFSSTQGFINHCRIAHKRDFKSHEEAAVHCGHPLDVDQGTAGQPNKATAAAAAADAAAAPVGGGAPPAPAGARATATPPLIASAPAALSTAPIPANAAAYHTTAYAHQPPPPPPPAVPAAPGHAFPLAQSDSETTNALLQHIEASFKVYTQRLPTNFGGLAREPVKREDATQKTFIKSEAASTRPSPALSSSAAQFVGSDKTPFLSRFLGNKQFAGNLDAYVADAKEPSGLDDAMWFAEDNYDDASDSPSVSTPVASAVNRVPARPTTSSTTAATTTTTTTTTTATPSKSVANLDGEDGRDALLLQPSGSKGLPAVARLPFGAASVSSSSSAAAMTFVKPESAGFRPGTQMYVDDEMDVDLSPNTSTSNNAPSLVSDDGDYDDSDDGSSSDTSDTDLESVSDVAEINTDEDEDAVHDTPRPLRHHRGSVKLKKDDSSKQATFVSPVKGSRRS